MENFETPLSMILIVAFVAYIFATATPKEGEESTPFNWNKTIELTKTLDLNKFKQSVENVQKIKPQPFNFQGTWQMKEKSSFNFGIPSSADISFFENEEAVDIETLIEEIIAEMDAEDDSTATSPSEE